VKLLVQPDDGAVPLVKKITGAKKSVEIVIFRFDQREVERALKTAVSRGISVQALIAHTNRAGEANLRKLEMRLLAAGVTVARTADDLVRYHAKYMIIDGRELFVLAFNLTSLDIERSRSFGVITRNTKAVAEASRLFQADCLRHPYEPGLDSLVVSPANARKQLSALIKSARKELLIYDLKVSDQSMIRLLEERTKAGVEVRVIGKITRKVAGISVCPLRPMRLHTRTIVVDRKRVFLGSQSLRESELDARREVGIVFTDAKAVNQVVKVFESDWALADQPQASGELDHAPVAKVAKKVAKAVARELPVVMPELHGAIQEAVGEKAEVELNVDEVEDLVKDAVKEAVAEALSTVVDGVIEQNGGSAREAGK
jgi:phosphatidylserine/phosphatidylglycerophosphate/cardiolipin synthase-like enzyme